VKRGAKGKVTFSGQITKRIVKLSFLQRTGSLDLKAAAAAQVIPSNVEGYVAAVSHSLRV